MSRPFDPVNPLDNTPVPNGRWGENSSHKNTPPSLSGERGRGAGGVGESTSAALIGEVVEASTTEFLAQAIELDAAPPFGAFVQVASDEAMTVYGVVAHVQTAGIDPGSRAIMRGHDDIRDERIYQENPDLPLVLRTTFRAVVVGFEEHGQIHQFLPPRPPRLHYSVFICPPRTVSGLTSVGFDYLQALLTAAEVPVDELLAANLRYTAQWQGGDFLQQAGRELAQLLRADYARLTGILRRCLAPMAPVELSG